MECLPSDDKFEGAGAVQYREEKALGRPDSSLSVSNEGYKKEGTDSLAGSVAIGQMEMVSN